MNKDFLPTPLPTPPTIFKTSAALVSATKAQAAAEAARLKPPPPTEADLIAVLREARDVGVTVKAVDNRVVVDAPPEAEEFRGKLSVYPDDMIADLLHAHQRYASLMAQPCLWDDEADEVMALARRFGYAIKRQRMDIEIGGAEEWYDVDETPAPNLNESE